MCPSVYYYIASALHKPYAVELDHRAFLFASLARRVTTRAVVMRHGSPFLRSVSPTITLIVSRPLIAEGFATAGPISRLLPLLLYRNCRLTVAQSLVTKQPLMTTVIATLSRKFHEGGINMHRSDHRSDRRARKSNRKYESIRRSASRRD